MTKYELKEKKITCEPRFFLHVTMRKKDSEGEVLKFDPLSVKRLKAMASCLQFVKKNKTTAKHQMEQLFSFSSLQTFLSFLTFKIKQEVTGKRTKNEQLRSTKTHRRSRHGKENL